MSPTSQPQCARVAWQHDVAMAEEPNQAVGMLPLCWDTVVPCSIAPGCTGLNDQGVIRDDTM